MALITCRDLSFCYGGRPVISGLSFEVSDGDYLCIVGENGSGKSTLINGLLGLKQPAGGKIELCGIKLNEIGYLPQQTPAQSDFPASVLEVVLSGRSGRLGARLFYSKEDYAEADRTLRELGIWELRRQSYRELSGGQRQRVLLCRALCAATKMLLLDEPAANLDPPATRELYRTIRQLNRQSGITVVMVSHDIQDALEHAGHILHLGLSRTFFGTTQEYRKSEIAQMFLGGNSFD